MSVIVFDYRGRALELLARVARKKIRYVTRKSVADVIDGKTTHTRPYWNCGSQARRGWPSKASLSRIKIGCHVFTGQNTKKIREWATS